MRRDLDYIKRRRKAKHDLEFLATQARAGMLEGMAVGNLPMADELKGIVRYAGCWTVRDFVDAPLLNFFSVPGCTQKSLDKLSAMQEVLRVFCPKTVPEPEEEGLEA